MSFLNFNGAPNQVKKVVYNGTEEPTSITFNGVPRAWAIPTNDFLPAGLIIGHSGTETIAGWSDFILADGKLLKGATTLASVGAGGSNSASKSVGTSTIGHHSGTNFAMLVHNTSASSAYCDNGVKSGGSHSHSLTVSGTCDQKRRNMRLIKADVDTTIVPQDSIFFSHYDLSPNVANIDLFEESTDALVGAHNTNRDIVGSTSFSMSGTTNSAGSHNHVNRTNYFWYYSGNSASDKNGGSSTHTVNIPATTNLKRLRLAAWTNALVAMEASIDMIGMWESDILPDGWVLCDGTNGTIDLRDYFISFGTRDTVGDIVNSSASDLDIPATNTSTTGSHSHHTGGYPYIGYQVPHSNGVSHRHASTVASMAFEPEHYALNFIMKV